ncbi:MAG: DUF58 domain-containing protein [Flavobacteriales bacterium]|nr:DUF58 domain-containing protein [Flavobacteriales bacterium]
MYIGKEKINITDNLDFFARQVVEGFLTGLHKSPYHGFSVEFAEHRLYNPGDSMKNIDWKLFARSNKLFVKKFEEETNLRCHLLLDTSSSMLYPKDSILSKLSFSVYSAASLMYLFRKQRDGFGLTYFTDKLNFFTDAKSTKSHYYRLIAELDQILNGTLLESNRKTNFPRIITDFVDKIHRRSLVIIFSDMLNFSPSYTKDLFDALQYLRYKKNEVVLFHVYNNETEKMFNFSNRPHTFCDLENSNSIELNPVNYKDEYSKLFIDFQQSLEMKCHQYKIDYISSPIEEGFNKILLSYLNKRSKLF